jgi:cytidyltransferase-like protein
MIVDFEYIAKYREYFPHIVMVSGGFDPLHIGHVRYIREAASLKNGDVLQSFLIAIVNGDSFLERKKKFKFMPLAERMEIVDAIKGVDFTIGYNSDDQTIIGALLKVRPNIFAKGGDRTSPENIPEWDTCQEIRCKIITDIGGGKIQSSSDLVNNVRG